MNVITDFLHKYHKSIMSVLGTLLMAVSYVASGNPKVASYLASYGLGKAVKCQCGCGCANCHCAK